MASLQTRSMSQVTPAILLKYFTECKDIFFISGLPTNPPETVTRYYCYEAVPGILVFGWDEMPCTVYVGLIGLLLVFNFIFCLCCCFRKKSDPEDDMHARGRRKFQRENSVAPSYDTDSCYSLDNEDRKWKDRGNITARDIFITSPSPSEYPPDYFDDSIFPPRKMTIMPRVGKNIKAENKAKDEEYYTDSGERNNAAIKEDDCDSVYHSDESPPITPSTKRKIKVEPLQLSDLDDKIQTKSNQQVSNKRVIPKHSKQKKEKSSNEGSTSKSNFNEDKIPKGDRSRKKKIEEKTGSNKRMPPESPSSDTHRQSRGSRKPKFSTSSSDYSDDEHSYDENGLGYDENSLSGSNTDSDQSSSLEKESNTEIKRKPVANLRNLHASQNTNKYNVMEKMPHDMKHSPHDLDQLYLCRLRNPTKMKRVASDIITMNRGIKNMQNRQLPKNNSLPEFNAHHSNNSMQNDKYEQINKPNSSGQPPQFVNYKEYPDKDSAYTNRGLSDGNYNDINQDNHDNSENTYRRPDRVFNINVAPQNPDEDNQLQQKFNLSNVNGEDLSRGMHKSMSAPDFRKQDDPYESMLNKREEKFRNNINGIHGSPQITEPVDNYKAPGTHQETVNCRSSPSRLQKKGEPNIPTRFNIYPVNASETGIESENEREEPRKQSRPGKSIGYPEIREPLYYSSVPGISDETAKNREGPQQGPQYQDPSNNKDHPYESMLNKREEKFQNNIHGMHGSSQITEPVDNNKAPGIHQETVKRRSSPSQLQKRGELDDPTSFNIYPVNASKTGIASENELEESRKQSQSQPERNIGHPEISEPLYYTSVPGISNETAKYREGPEQGTQYQNPSNNKDPNKENIGKRVRTMINPEEDFAIYKKKHDTDNDGIKPDNSQPNRGILKKYTGSESNPLKKDNRKAHPISKAPNQHGRDSLNDSAVPGISEESARFRDIPLRQDNEDPYKTNNGKNRKNYADDSKPQSIADEQQSQSVRPINDQTSNMPAGFDYAPSKIAGKNVNKPNENSYLNKPSGSNHTPNDTSEPVELDDPNINVVMKMSTYQKVLDFINLLKKPKPK
ncbi:unnamed protein product [Mytilus coruscus]|uniref:Uncharacterized protein n=1 Tax=Mytilus coruscus TaxID=42192 RepID=A0A6J8BF69_MYTCO|nr:unnamed protein product [Mytilus coruscus]